jgi:DNA invertase Pin-like site-specific DNA recombinase
MRGRGCYLGYRRRGLIHLNESVIRERTSAGIVAARAEGRVGGRRPKLTVAQQADIAKNVLSGRNTAAQMARLYKVSQPTVSRLLAAHRHATEAVNVAPQ